MVKYRRLSEKELGTFEKEFVNFLVVNGITAEDWVKIKANELEKAETLIDLFSDVILEGTLRKIQFLELQSPAYYQSIFFGKDKMVTVVLSRKDKNRTMIDENLSLETMLNSSDYEIFKGQKDFTKEREMEVFEMTKKGFLIGDGTFFKLVMNAES
jgi:hypothetical protein